MLNNLLKVISLLVVEPWFEPSCPGFQAHDFTHYITRPVSAFLDYKLLEDKDDNIILYIYYNVIQIIWC